MDPSTVRFGRAAQDYATHRQGFPHGFFDRLSGWGIGRPGQRLLDLATGTGTIARGFAMKGCTVTGLDHDGPMLKAAEELARDEGLSISWIESKAEQIPLADASFEVITAGQCWHWFDKSQVASECMRLLVPGGRLVIGHFDWIPLDGNVAWRTERLIEAHNPSWKLGGGNGIHATELADLGNAGFLDLETFSFDVVAEYTHEAWRGRIRASAGVGGSLSKEKVAIFDRHLAALLAEIFPEEPLSVLHRVFAVIGQKPIQHLD